MRRFFDNADQLLVCQFGIGLHQTGRKTGDDGRGEGGVPLAVEGEEVVSAPPEAEEGTEDEGCAEAVVNAANAVRFELLQSIVLVGLSLLSAAFYNKTYRFFQAVYRPTV